MSHFPRFCQQIFVWESDQMEEINPPVNKIGQDLFARKILGGLDSNIF